MIALLREFENWDSEVYKAVDRVEGWLNEQDVELSPLNVSVSDSISAKPIFGR